METDKEIESLREQVRTVTTDIIRSVQKRMDLARQIGEIKGRIGIDIRDEKVEREIRALVLSTAQEQGMDDDFALRLLNILLDESESVQSKGRRQPPRQTHLGIFMRARELEASGKEMIHLEVGEPDYPPPSAVGIAISEAFAQKRYHYTETRGIAKLREALARREGVGEREVIVTPGGRFAVFSAVVSLLRPGNEMIVIEPSWPAYKECADFIGAKTRVLRTRLDDGWTPDLAQLEEMIGPATKMIVLNYPNNPTGKILPNQILEKIVSMAREHRLYLLSDEVYSDYSFATKFKSVMEFDYDRRIMVSSFSKRYAMTGFRVGYAVAEQEIIKKMSKVQAVGITSVAEPMQHAALAALNQDFEENVKLMRERIDYLCSRLDKMALRFARPDGAMYVYPELPGIDDMKLVEVLLERGVAVAPGSGFGDSYSKFIRISACRPIDVLAKGMDRVESLIKELR
ncbi:MAG TPA: aminotransferase class I/II-fold pyridoxal phosphate-dependent enzyme [Nitrososphaera sp.]|nr:aminotransferase class I/II-fold pyridoxal phosphate-dependent enzyme [Nitrososphaera sp.]